MFSTRTLLLGLAFLCLPHLTRASAPPSDLTVAVADFSGADKEMGGFIAETLMTDLARSEKLHLIECSEVRQSLADLKLPSSGPFESPQVRRLGRTLTADRLVVGSYLVRDDRLIVNARLLNMETGEPIPGGAANISGNRHDLLSLTHRLARQFHRRVTGSDLALDAETPEPDVVSSERPAPVPTPASREDDRDSLESLRQSGLIPATARPNGIVSERDLGLVVRRLARQVASSRSALAIPDSRTPVTRIRALTALVKTAANPEDIAAYRDAPPDNLTPDTTQIPSWGKSFVAVALDRGWWDAGERLHARDTATWSFVAGLLSRMPLQNERADERTSERAEERPAPPPPAPEDEDRAYTGLILDARDFPIERAMSPRILDEDGRVVYPDPKYIPSDDYVLDHGMASYEEDIQSAKRAGSHPLIIRAMDISGPAHDDVVVSNQAAERIRRANRRGKFLARWAVSILSEPR